MRKLLPSILALWCLGTSPGNAAVQWVTAYYPVWSLGSTNGGNNNPMYPTQVKWAGITHVVHFGVGPDQTPPYWHPASTNNFGGPSNDSLNMFYGVDWRGNTSYRMVDSLKRYVHAAGAKLLLSCGGIWGAQAAAMNYITADSSRTQVFVDAVVAFAGRHGYDGMEIDYEPPQSRTALSLLTRIMKRKMTTALGPAAPLVMTVANLAENNYSVALADSVAQYLFMMYDMHNPYNGIGSPGGPYDVTGFNAPIHLPNATQYPVVGTASLNFDGTRPAAPSQFWGPNKFASMGFPRNKIGVGIPFYGYVFDTKNAPNQSATGVYAHYLNYVDALGFLTRGGGTYHWDNTAKVPWAGGTAVATFGWVITAGHQTYVTYEDTNSVREKARWANAGGFGGMMIYELWTGWVNSAPAGQKQPLLDILMSEAGVSPPPDTIPPPPFLDMPVNGSAVVTLSGSTPVSFGWSNVMDATSYQLQMATDQAFTNIILARTAPTNGLSESIVLTLNHTYYWRVASVNGLGQSAFSFPFSFVDRAASDTVRIPVSPGWNMVSLPLSREQRRTAEVFGSAISSLYAFDNASGFVRRDTFQYGLGYWLRFALQDLVAVPGLFRSTDTLSVSAGWNVIGTISHPVAITNIIQSPSGIVRSAFLGSIPYRNADTLVPGLGYWVKISQDGRLILR